ncbi:MAG: TorF family putative porin [Steroidobacteraceae bacterium]
MRAAAGLPLSRSAVAEHSLAAIRAAATIAALAALAVALLGPSVPASAADYFGGSIGLTSDYIYKGLSHTCGAPAAQADLHVSTSGGQAPSEIFAGAWGSVGLGADDSCRRSREINLYAGMRVAPSAAQSLRLTYIHYAFPGGTYLYEGLEGRRFDYDELGGTWAFEDRLFLSLAWTPNALEYPEYGFKRDRTALSFGVQVHQPIGTAFEFSAGAGYDEMNDPSGAGYAFWNVGLGRGIGPVQLDLSYFRTAARAEHLFGPEIAGGRVAASAVWRF